MATQVSNLINSAGGFWKHDQILFQLEHMLCKRWDSLEKVHFIKFGGIGFLEVTKISFLPSSKFFYPLFKYLVRIILLAKLIMIDTSILITLSHNILILIHDSIVNNFLFMIYNPFLSLSLSLSHDLCVCVYCASLYILSPVDSSLSTLYQFLWRWKDKQTNLMFLVDSSPSCSQVITLHLV